MVPVAYLDVYLLFGSDTLEVILEQLLVDQGPSSEPDRLVREAAQGHIEVVKDIISKHSDKVSQIMYSGIVSGLSFHENYRKHKVTFYN